MENVHEAIDQLCSQVLPGMTAIDGSDVRNFVATVLEFRSGDIAAAADWLSSSNNALQQKSPVELIQEGNTAQLIEFWKGCKRVYGS